MSSPLPSHGATGQGLGANLISERRALAESRRAKRVEPLLARTSSAASGSGEKMREADTGPLLYF